MSITAYITWNVDPEIFHFGVLSLRWYGLLFGMAFVLGYFITRRMFRKLQIPEKEVDTLLWYVALGTFIGARLGHCLFYEPGYFLHHPLEIILPFAPDSDGVFHFTGYQGLASHGAAVGIVVSLLLFVRKRHHSFLQVFDCVVTVVALSGFMIRMGNLFNSEIYGTPTSLAWGFIFVRDGATIPCHPTQLYEALSYLLIFAGLCYGFFRTDMARREGVLSGIAIVAIFTMRFLIEFVKRNQVDFEQGMVLNMGQLLSLPFIAAGLWLIFRKREKADSKM